MGGPGSGKSSKVIRRTRPQTTLVCRFRSKRTPKWSEQDAARVCCAAIAQGGTMKEIIARTEATCPAAEENKASEQQADLAIAEQAEVVVGLIGDMDAVLGAAYQEFLVINGLIGALVIALSVLGRFPGLRIVSRRALALLSPIAAVQSRIIGVRSSANDAVFRLRSIQFAARRAA